MDFVALVATAGVADLELHTASYEVCELLFEMRVLSSVAFDFAAVAGEEAAHIGHKQKKSLHS
eukprot:6988974-Prorocentrum_lima.AAC.1